MNTRSSCGSGSREVKTVKKSVMMTVKTLKTVKKFVDDPIVSRTPPTYVFNGVVGDYARVSLVVSMN